MPSVLNGRTFRIRTACVALSALLTLLLISPIHTSDGQKEDSSNAENTLRVDVNLVTVGVSVTHRKGPVEARLRAEDFTLYEDGKAQKLSFFSAEEQPLSLALLIDRSNSMAEGDKMEQVKRALLSLVESSHSNTEFLLLAFHHSVSRLLDFSTDRERVRSVIRRCSAERGGSSFYDGIMEALGQMSRAKYPRQALIVITDGADQHSENTLEGVVRGVQSSQLEVFMIGVFDKKEEEIFQQSGKVVTLISGQEVDNPRYSFRRLAEESGADCYFPRSSKELAESMSHIGRDLEQQYTLAYYAGAGDYGDRYRKIEVKSRKSGIRIRARRGYRLPGAVKDLTQVPGVSSKPAVDALRRDKPYESRVTRTGGRLVYAENFESAETGWPNSHEMYSREGKFHIIGRQMPVSMSTLGSNYGLERGSAISTAKASSALVASNGPWLHDFQATVLLEGLETLGELSSGGYAGAGGLVFRFNEKGYYALLVSGHSKSGLIRFSLVRKDVLSPQLVPLVPWTNAPGSHEAHSPLKIGVTCQKSHLRLLLDNRAIYDLDDSHLGDGMVGMMLVGKGHAMFDDLIAEELSSE